jgi:hypothetical protein
MTPKLLRFLFAVALCAAAASTPARAAAPAGGTPSTGTPSTGTPSTGTPSTGTPSTGAPSPLPPLPAKQPGPFLGGFLRETRVIYPLRVGDWEAVGEHLYENQALGASVRYRDRKHEDRWLDLYFYPAGVLEAHDFDEATQVQRESLRLAGYGQLDMGPTRRFGYVAQEGKVDGQGRKSGKAKPREGHSLDAFMVHEGTRLHSALTLQYENLYFIKGRLSAPQAEVSRRALRTTLEDFASALAPRLQVRSGGDCWQPLPIAAMPAAGVADSDVVLTMDDGAGMKSVVTGTGVWSSRPDSVEARLAMLVGMIQLGRLHEGCVATEDLNAPVPEGMRELRLEFHAPDETSDAPVRRLRPARTAEG